MMLRTALFVSVLGLSACATKEATVSPDDEIKAFMTAYTVTWNKHDAAGVAKNFYRLEGRTVEQQTEANKKTFADLVAQGYDKSDIHEVAGCVTGPGTAWGGMKFTRMTKDGGFLPPKDRASSYELKKFPDGWRITKVGGADVTKPLTCPKA